MSTDNLIPISYVKKFTPLVVGDKIFNNYLGIEITLTESSASLLGDSGSNPELYVISFANRPNTGTQPVDDDVIVDCVTDGGDKKSAWRAEDVTWEDYYKESAMAPDLSHHDVSTWKPNHAALLSKFKSEQGKAMNTNSDIHHITLQVEALGNGFVHHIDLAITAKAVRDVVISPDEPVDSRTDEDKAIDDMGQCLASYYIGGIHSAGLISDIKAGKIHGVKWVGE